MNFKSKLIQGVTATTTLVASSVLFASSAMAENISVEHDQCNVELNYGLQIKGETITFYDGKKELYRIEQDRYLIVEQDEVGLDSHSQTLVTDYSQGIRAMVPKVKSIAIDGIELAAEGVNMAFSELLGEGDSLVIELDEEFAVLRDEISERFNEQNFSMNYEGDDASNWDEEFENRVEEVVESAVEKSIGSLMIAIGTKMLTSGGDMDAFEKDMESFGQRIEYQMETKAEAIEERANQLCVDVEQLAEIESQMVSEIPELEGMQAIDYSVNKKRSKNYRM